MKFYPLVRGEKLPEVYHLGFDGKDFLICLNPTYWDKFVKLTGAKSRFAAIEGPEYVPPTFDCKTFGQSGCVRVDYVQEGFTCIKVPASLPQTDMGNQVFSLDDVGRTLAGILSMLEYLLLEAREANDPVTSVQQLFVLNTFLANEPGLKSAAIELSVSPRARKYFESLGSRYVFEEAIAAKRDHYLEQDTNTKKVVTFLYSDDFGVCVRRYGILEMRTMGPDMCMGTPERDLGNEGYHLTSDNVDSVFLQFNLLVGIAYVWQMTRTGIRLQDK